MFYYICFFLSAITRRHFISYIPLDNINNSSIINNPNLSPITQCYFDSNDQLWKPFLYDEV